MTQKKSNDKLDKLVYEKFADYDVVERKKDSPNARHYVMQKNSETKHLKVIKKSYIEANDYSEIALLHSVHSEYVIRLEEFGDIDEDNTFLIFPHVNGTTLDKMHQDGGWDDASIKKLTDEVLSGLADLAVSGIVHRDIKPKNIIYDNVNKKYIILDLGIGYFIEGPNKDNTKIPKGIGPKYYSAPEQFKIAIREPYSLTQATDQFSLGVILYELAANKHPFIEFSDTDAQSYATLVMDEALPKPLNRSVGLSDDVSRVIEKMLSREPSQRYLTLDQIRKDLGAYSTRRSI